MDFVDRFIIVINDSFRVHARKFSRHSLDKAIDKRL